MADGWTCTGCSRPGDVYGFRDSQEHLLVCEGYGKFREGRDLHTDEGLVKFFHDVISDRLGSF